ncbi:MAG: hypothetical protein B1H08_04750 [Candidatus Omnitrophica bacterium 4484_171]|nr:MAG: hypothetical protein B1H08_04750 [Candidatus Omnitrophica bacterium 4484_171]
MAETLGSLVDKLAIKSIRELCIKRMLKQKRLKFTRNDLKRKLDILRKQKKYLCREIEDFIVLAARRKVTVKDDKLKLYNSLDIIGKVKGVNSISRGIEALTKKNLELWSLEDEARRRDVPLSYIGRIKRKIDVANQKRNDLIDRIDELLESKLKEIKKQ